MKNVFLLLVVLAMFGYGCGLFGGKGTGHHGELTSVLDRPQWDQYQPLGMVYVPPGSFHMGQNDQDVPYSQIAHTRQITISAFYMDEHEITNNEYRQFLYGPSANEAGSAGQENGAYDTIDPMYVEIIVPDTTVWLRDFVYAYNEPLMENYFWHPAFDEYPVVGVNWYAAAEFCKWRTAHLNQYREENEQAAMPRFRLPTEAEWEYAARGGYEHKLYPWEGPYLRNSRGCFLANFKPGRGDYIADNFEYTAPVYSYFPNDYGLFNMPGNVAEWCEDDFEETGYTYAHDLNPRYLNPKIKEDQRIPGGAKYRKVIRGGSWKDIGYFLSCGTRSYEYADTAKSFIGFRCAVTVIGRSGASNP
ncbi:MAG: SUMF1/EgtB/PvdO family nonheme iron enzyme [Bacteroidia bacterium]|nr:SUMF1/EgtB/PvdO family nonheme iron enzyme [Bacteroidia bacterium]